MERIKLLKDLSRMCRVTNCLRCPIQSLKVGRGNPTCIEVLGNHPEKIINIVEKWSQAHPEKTILDDVKEKFPNISLNDEGIPDMCPSTLGYFILAENDECEGKNCAECWKQKLK